MKRWWIRPVVRLVAALLLPLAVPLIITALIWMLPGDPASIICPPEACGGTGALAERWNLDRGPVHFFTSWLGGAVSGDFGNSWRLQQGVSVAELLGAAIPSTLALIGLAMVLVMAGALSGATGWIHQRFDPILQVVGVAPALVLSLIAAASVELALGADSFGDTGTLWRLLAGALVLGLADGAFAGAVTGVRGVFQRENAQRYVGIALLRGETRLSNTLLSVAPAMVGQLRARALHLLSGAVVVEVVLRIDGLGDLLWRGTLLQDFGVVLAAASGFAVVSAALLLVQASLEVLVAVQTRRTPLVAADEGHLLAGGAT